MLWIFAKPLLCLSCVLLGASTILCKWTSNILLSIWFVSNQLPERWLSACFKNHPPPPLPPKDAKRVRKTDNIYSSCSMSNHFSRWSSWPRGNHEDAADHVVIWFSASSLAYKIHSSSPNTVCLCSTTSLHCPRWQSLYGWLKWSEAKVSHMFRQLMAPPLKRFSAWNPFSGGKRTHSCIGLLFSDDVAFRGFFSPLVFRV